MRAYVAIIITADGDHETVAELIDLGADPAEQIGFIKKTTLHAAAGTGQAAAVAALLATGQVRLLHLLAVSSEERTRNSVRVRT